MAIDRAALRAKLAGRTAQSYNTKDSEGGFRSYVRSIYDRPLFKKFPEGSIMLDLIPILSPSLLISSSVTKAARESVPTALMGAVLVLRKLARMNSRMLPNA